MGEIDFLFPVDYQRNSYQASIPAQAGIHSNASIVSKS
jgi:hypothetical protein